MKDKIIKGLIFKYIIIIVVVVLIAAIIGAGYIYIIEDDGIWDEKENSPRSYKNSSKVTSDGLKTDNQSIIEDALRNKGYDTDAIERLRQELSQQGYSGDELENKLEEKIKKILGLELDGKISNINSAQLIWLLNKDTYSKYLKDYTELEYLMNAELVTQMPYIKNISSSNALNGTIHFKRHTTDNSVVELEYIDEVQFENKINSSQSDVLKYFTMSDDGKVKIAQYYKESGKIETNDSTANASNYDSNFSNNNLSYEKSGYNVQNISYSTMVPRRYSMPFEYMWALLVMTENYDFVKALADLSYNSEIVISIYDNVSENTEITEYKYSRQQKDYSEIKSKCDETTSSVSTTKIVSEGMIGIRIVEPTKTLRGSKQDVLNEVKQLQKEYDKEEYYVRKIIYTYTNIPEIKLTYANVWLAEYTTEYNYYTEGHKVDSGIPDSSETTIYGEETEVENEGSRKIDQLISSSVVNTSESTENRKIVYVRSNVESTKQYNVEVTTKTNYLGDTWSTTITSPTTISQQQYLFQTKYVNNPDKTTTREKTNVNSEEKNFCTLLKSANGYNFIVDFPYNEWLFNILENNKETADMVDLTKYLINKFKEKEVFKLENFSFENLFKLTEIGALYGDSVEEQLWFALLDAGYSKIAASGVLGNIEKESGFKTNNLQNTYEDTLGKNDEQYTEEVDSGIYTNFINDSAGYGLCQWTSAGRKEGLYYYAKDKGVGISDTTMQIEFLLAEISPSGGAGGRATFQMGSTKKNYSYSSWVNATEPEEAAMAFCYVFERPKEGDHSDRGIKAKYYYDKYKDAEKTEGKYFDGEYDSRIGLIKLTGENAKKMKNMLQEAIRIADDNRYLYSQSLRNDEFHYDCSSLVGRLYTKYFNIKMPSRTIEYSKFDQYCISSNPVSIELQPGDILWRGKKVINKNGEEEWQGHVVIYIGNGNYVAAHTDNKPPADQITVYRDKPSNYTKVYRFIK